MCHYKFYTRALKNELSDKLHELKEESDSHLEVKQVDDLYEVIYELQGEQEKCDEFMAHVISDVIQKQAIIKECREYLKVKEELSILEQREVADAFLRNNYLSRQEGFSYMTYYLLYVPIFKEIKARQGFHIEGWLAFRIQKYKTVIRDTLQQFTADYLAKKEVVSFIKLMRDVSLLAVPLEDKMHILCTKEGKLELYNAEYKRVTGHYIKKYCKELLLDSTLMREDLLLHVLITISPKEIIVHHGENLKSKQFLNTLEIIFDQGIRLCKGCKFCEKLE